MLNPLWEGVHYIGVKNQQKKAVINDLSKELIEGYTLLKIDEKETT